MVEVLNVEKNSNKTIPSARSPQAARVGFYYPFMSLCLNISPQSISAVRNKLVDIVRSKPCFWEENLLTLHAYH